MRNCIKYGTRMSLLRELNQEQHLAVQPPVHSQVLTRCLPPTGTVAAGDGTLAQPCGLSQRCDTLSIKSTAHRRAQWGVG